MTPWFFHSKSGQNFPREIRVSIWQTSVLWMHAVSWKIPKIEVLLEVKNIYLFENSVGGCFCDICDAEICSDIAYFSNKYLRQNERIVFSCFTKENQAPLHFSQSKKRCTTRSSSLLIGYFIFIVQNESFPWLFEKSVVRHGRFAQWIRYWLVNP